LAPSGAGLLKVKVVSSHCRITYGVTETKVTVDVAALLAMAL
jgi:hypothetical protein